MDHKTAITNITSQIQKEFEDVFMGIRCFEGTFSLQVKPDSKPYQVPPSCVAYALQKQFKEELEKLQRQDIIALFGMIRQRSGATALFWYQKSMAKQSKALPRPGKIKPSAVH